jgi:hypothetical protein
MNPSFIPADQLQRMITNQLFQGLKQGPGAAPFNPVPYQLQQIQSQMQAQTIAAPTQIITPINPPGIMPPVPHNNLPGCY